MMFGGLGQHRSRRLDPDHPRALDAGINFIDTADVYSRGESEEIVGKALAGGRRDDVVLATKFHGTMGDDPNQSATRGAGSCARSRTRCGACSTDYIDLYQIHRPERDTDIDETLGALTRPRARQGKVRYIGSSTFPASQIVEAQWVARDRGRERFVCEQPPYSMLVRGIEADVLPTCALRHGRDPVEPARRRLAVGPLAQGRRGAAVHARRAAARSATTSRSPATSASSRPPTRSRGSPTRPA